jgi:hypothetical protein
MKFIYFLIFLIQARSIMNLPPPSCRDIYTKNKGGGVNLSTNEPFLFLPENHIKFDAYKDQTQSDNLWEAYNSTEHELTKDTVYNRPGMIWIFKHEELSYLCLSSIRPGRLEITKQFLLVDPEKAAHVYGCGRGLVFKVAKVDAETSSNDVTAVRKPEIHGFKGISRGNENNNANNDDGLMGKIYDDYEVLRNEKEKAKKEMSEEKRDMETASDEKPPDSTIDAAHTDAEMHLLDNYVENDVKSLCIVLFRPNELKTSSCVGETWAGNLTKEGELVGEGKDSTVVDQILLRNTDWAQYLSQNGYTINFSEYKRMPTPATPESLTENELQPVKKPSVGRRIINYITSSGDKKSSEIEEVEPEDQTSTDELPAGEEKLRKHPKAAKIDTEMSRYLGTHKFDINMVGRRPEDVPLSFSSPLPNTPRYGISYPNKREEQKRVSLHQRFLTTKRQNRQKFAGQTTICGDDKERTLLRRNSSKGGLPVRGGARNIPSIIISQNGAACKQESSGGIFNGTTGSKFQKALTNPRNKQESSGGFFIGRSSQNGISGSAVQKALTNPRKQESPGGLLFGRSRSASASRGCTRSPSRSPQQRSRSRSPSINKETIVDDNKPVFGLHDDRDNFYPI